MPNLLTITPQLLDIGNEFGDLSFLFGLTIIVIIFSALVLVPCIFFLLTLQNTLKAISPENRRLMPGKVLLLLIPFFSFVWMFFVVSDIAQSIYQEFKSRNIPIQNKPTRSLGITMSILICVHFLFSVAGFILKYVLSVNEVFVMVFSLISYLPLFAVIITWIIYWIKVAEYKKQILTLPKADQQAKNSGKYFTT